MDNPPPLPLGRTFYILLIAPLSIMGLALAVDQIGGHNSANDWGMPISCLALLAMFVCSIICAVIVGKRRTVGLAILTFIGIQVVYVSVAFAGCGLLMQGMSFR